VSKPVRDWAITCSPTMSTDRSVLIVLADRAGRNGYAWPSTFDLAERSGFARSTVVRSLKSLEQAGVIVVVPQDFLRATGVRRFGRTVSGQHTVTYRFRTELCRHADMPAEERPRGCDHDQGVSLSGTKMAESATPQTLEVAQSTPKVADSARVGDRQRDTELKEPWEELSAGHEVLLSDSGEPLCGPAALRFALRSAQAKGSPQPIDAAIGDQG
jgi:hypothetical protein